MSYLARLKAHLADPQPETGPLNPVPKVPKGPFVASGTAQCRGVSGNAAPDAAPRGRAPTFAPREGGDTEVRSDWRDGVARLDPGVAPCPGFRAREWPAVHRTIARFMAEHAAEATRLGWGTLDLFGVDPTIGAAAVDRCGALVLPLPHPASAVNADAIAFGPVTYRKRPLPGSVPAWDATPRRAVPGNE